MPASVRAAAPSRDVNSLGLEAAYEVHATFDWGSRAASVATTIRLRGSMPWPTSLLALDLSTLRTGHAHLTQTSVDGASVKPMIDDQTVVVPLDPPLEPGGTRTVEVDYTGRLNADPDPDSDDWGFARTTDFMTGYRWIPWLSRTTPFDRRSVGDPYVTASSPSVRVTIDSDPALTYAATGEQTSSAGGERTFEAHDVRDFNFSASPSYRRAERTVRGTTIRFLYRRLDPSLVLDVAARAFNEYSARIGAYPYRLLTIGEVGPWSPLELPTHFWLPDNAPKRLLPWMTAHETAHQWFYAVVGNDQARQPFADEALADYISRDQISRFVPSQCPPGRLDSTIYDLGACYPWVVYVQGDAFLRDLRQRIGSGAFWSALRSYYAHNRSQIAGTRQLLTALGAQGWSETKRRFPSLFIPPIPCRLF